MLRRDINLHLFATKGAFSDGTLSAYGARMAEPAFRVSLRTKWTLALVATALGPLLLVGVATLKLQRDGLMDAEKDLQAAVAMQTGKSVGFAVSDVSDTSHRVGRLLTSATSQSERDPEAGAALIQLAKAEVEG